MKWSTRTVGELDQYLILSPERYIGRRRGSKTSPGVLLSELTAIRRETLSPGKVIDGKFRVADTGDAEEGVLKLHRQPVDKLGSTKKRLHAGDVIISRLRPYLRQVAYVDSALFIDDIDVVCSTEFYVLRPIGDDSISFLVPWLLSSGVQSSLASSLEGAHHPRFHDSALVQLRVPAPLLESRAELSREVESAIESYRVSRRVLSRVLTKVENSARIADPADDA